MGVPAVTSFGQRLRAARKARGWSIMRLANAADLKADRISMYERGEAGLQLDTFMRLCEALELTPCDLLGAPCDVGRLSQRVRDVSRELVACVEDVERLRRRVG